MGPCPANNLDYLDNLDSITIFCVYLIFIIWGSFTLSTFVHLLDLDYFWFNNYFLRRF